MQWMTDVAGGREANSSQQLRAVASTIQARA